MPLVLTPAQLRDFQADGYLHIKGFFSAEELVDVQRDSKELVERGLQGPFGDKRWVYTDPKAMQKRIGGEVEPGGPIPHRVNGLHDPDMPASIQMLLGHPRLLTVASQLMGGDVFASSVQSMVYKVPLRGLPVPWHQDPVEVRRFPAFNMDIYLDPAHEGNACVYVVPGSHLAGIQPTNISAVTGGVEGPIEGLSVPVICGVGDLVVHATTLVHGSWWNRSDELRRTVYFHFDHLEDVALAADGKVSQETKDVLVPKFPGGRGACSFGEALRRTQRAVEIRAKARPDETAFPLRATTSTTTTTTTTTAP